MRKILAITLFAISSLTFAQRTIKITPDVITAPDAAPTVCVEGFKPNTIVVVMLPSFSYNFIIQSRGEYCHSPNYIFDLDPAVYEVPSIVCDYQAGSLPTKCKSGPTVNFTVN